MHSVNDSALFRSADRTNPERPCSRCGDGWNARLLDSEGRCPDCARLDEETDADSETADPDRDAFVDAMLVDARAALDEELRAILPQHLLPAALARCVPSDVTDPAVAVAVLRAVRVS